MPAKKRLVVCCDGTWNSADGVQEFTNVVRIARAVRPHDARVEPEIAQIVHYQAGVGTGGDAVQHLVGGAVGMGLSRNVRDAYAFLAHNYCEGDEVFLFGFSRGAYTARSVAGLIGYTGLLYKRDMDDFALLWEGYRLKGEAGRPDVRARFPERHAAVPIRCVGVWDTVGALGVPGHLGRLFTRFYQFHDTELGAHVEHAFQALALDETRSDFEPAVWTQKPEGRANGQVLRQVWFPGVHSDVGGGYDEHGLSDVALAWMAGRVEPLLALDEGYLRLRQDRRAGWGLGRVHDSARGAWWFLGTEARRPFTKQPRAATFEGIHPSVGVRLASAGGEREGYESPALSGIDLAGKLVTLAPLEVRLRWSDADAAASDRPERPSSGVLGRLLDDLDG